jgi:hypothetical protein
MQDPTSRRFPRATVSLPCAVDDASGRLVRGRLWSATCEGVGLGLERGDLPTGHEVRLTFRVLGEAIEVPARVVWRRDDDGGVWAGAALALDTAPEDVPATYAHWLLTTLYRERAEACRAGALLAINRIISLRTLQAALDAHAVTGGSLAGVLAAMGLPSAVDALAAAGAAARPATQRVALPRALTEWAEQWRG